MRGVVVTRWRREREALGSNPGKTSGEKILTREDFNSTFFGLLMTQILRFARLFSRVPTFYLNPF